MRAIALNLIKKHEGLRLRPYFDSLGHVTIGYGRNLQERGISEAEAASMLDSDIDNCIEELKNTYDFWELLNEVRQAVLVDMCYNLGIKRLGQFKRMEEAIRLRTWSKASFEMLNSVWARQVGGRAKELALLMKTGGL